MKDDSVPQDKASTYEGHKRLLYAVDKHGNYDGVQSSGWEVEEYATLAAVDEYNQLTREAFDRASAGVTSALEYHMYAHRMDLALLAQVSGLFQWRIKRHFKPAIFKKLNQELLRRYSDALNMEIADLQKLPPTPAIQFK
jgi:hypothetical protein